MSDRDSVCLKNYSMLWNDSTDPVTHIVDPMQEMQQQQVPTIAKQIIA